MRVRTQTAEPDTPVAASADPADTSHAELRERGAALLAAADDAISRALSRDSAVFLAQNRQVSGE